MVMIKIYSDLIWFDQDLDWFLGLGHFEIAKLLIENRANVNAKEENGETPLLKAAWNGNVIRIEPWIWVNWTLA